MNKTTKQKLKKIMSSFELFSKNFIKIVNPQNEVVPFKLNKAQQELTEMINNDRFLIVSKSRKAGVSTKMIARAVYECVTKPNQLVLIVSYESDSAKNLFELIKFMNNHLPREKYPSLFPATKRDNRDELILENGSKIVSTVAGHKDIGRGMSPTWVHLSEFSFYGNQEKQLLSIEQSLVDNGRISIESTSNGLGNYYYRLWQRSKRGQSKYKPYFIPFYHELYRDLKKNELNEAESWHKQFFGERLSKKDLDEDEQALLDNGCNLRFLMWRRFKLQDMQLEEFYQEYPSNDMESFISSGNNVFDQNKILQRTNHLMPPINKNELSELPDSLQRYLGKELLIYHTYDRKMKYYAGIDVATASSGTGDYSTITILDEEGIEACSFASNKLPVYKFGLVANDLLRHYGQAFTAIERNNVGIVLIEKLRDDYNYLNLYKEKLFDQKGKRKKQLGFTTTKSSKPILIEKFKENFELGYILLNDKETLEQMQIYQIQDGKMGNKGNGHDDKVISAALSVLARLENKWYI
ncbi:DNA packaging protein [Halobacillus amylolyticus]|uniref:DNA packaging protein n=1 Tax=Halobacillus amylolyticus TaxID=2932259 RepID=A0ABY4HBH3_9BACI|nr:DNA packaging protein [Halobacillus amylolyticus]UOR12187.1 DNA packaging protein [Halobacillus amylolyticus]